MVFTNLSIAVKKPLHHHFSRFFVIITEGAGRRTRSSDKPRFVFIIIPLLTRAVNYPAFKEKETLPYEQARIDAPLTISYRPMTVTEDPAGQIEVAFDTSEPDTISIMMTFESAENKVFVCDTPLDFPSTGARVTRIEMTVTPLEIRYLLDFEITDLAIFTQQ